MDTVLDTTQGDAASEIIRKKGMSGGGSHLLRVSVPESGRLVVVSNRLAPARKGKPASGGLAVGVAEALSETGGIWFGWSGRVVDAYSHRPRREAAGSVTYASIDLCQRDIDEYYNGFSNQALWPILHYRLDLMRYDAGHREGYYRVNDVFARALEQLIGPSDLIWVNDYHMIPLGTALRRLGATQPIGFFLHTPFPPKEILASLPGHRALLQELSAFDLIGFQTQADLRCFRDYAQSELGAQPMGNDWLKLGGRLVRTGTFPIGIDTGSMERYAREGEASRPIRRVRDSLMGCGTIIGVDRLDYSKGLPERLRAYDRYLEKWAERAHHASLLQISPPTRMEVKEYADLRQQVMSLAGEINARHGEPHWVPIRYVNKSLSRKALAGLYRLSAVGLVTPLRDGMNLVAKEYVAAQRPADPGVLVLSQFAGAAQELDGALLVNPHDIDEMADAIHRALTMPLEERRARWEGMIAALRRNDAASWCRQFLAALIDATAPPLEEPAGIAVAGGGSFGGVGSAY